MSLSPLLVLGLCLISGTVVQATELAVDMELVLAVDASDSMDNAERQLQRAGYVAAFESPDLIAEMLSGPHARIAVTYVEWGDPGLAEVIVPWTVIADHDDAAAFAARLARGRKFQFTKTAIGDALWFCRGLFDRNSLAGTRRVIDLSGNGPSNLGRPVSAVRDRIVDEGILINGLPIMVRLDSPRGPFGLDFDRRNLARYFAECVIGGPNAFALPVYDLAALSDAIRLKLRIEVAGSTGRQQPISIATSTQWLPSPAACG